MNSHWIKMDTKAFDRKSLKKFAMTMAVALAIIGILLLVRKKTVSGVFFGVSGLFIVVGMIKAEILKPVYILWMKLAVILAFVNTRVILSILFYAVITPVGLVMRLFGKDLLDRGFKSGSSSFWVFKPKRQSGREEYERQY